MIDEIFKLWGTIEINRSEAERNIDSVTSKAESGSKRMDSAFAKVAKSVDNISTSLDHTSKKLTTLGNSLTKKAGLPLTALITTITALTKTTANYADTVANSSEMVGLSTQAYQELQYAMEQCNIEQAEFERALGRLNQRMGNARNGNEKMRASLKGLGLDLERLDAGAISTDEAFMHIIGTLEQMEDSQLQASIAADIFGTRMARLLLPSIQSGTQSIEELRQKAHELGFVMDEEAVRRTDLFGDSLTDLSRTIGGLNRALSSELFVPLTRLTDWLTDITAGTTAWVKDNPTLVRRIIITAGALGIVLATTVALGTAFKVVGGIIRGFTFLLTLLTSKPFLLIATVSLLYTAWNNDWGNIRTTVEGAVDGIISKLEELVTWFQGTAVGQAVSAFWANLQETWTSDENESGFIAKIEATAGHVSTALGQISGALYGLVPDHIKTHIENFWSGVTSAWDTAVTQFQPKVPGFPEIKLPEAPDITEYWSKITNAWEKGQTVFTDLIEGLKPGGIPEGQEANSVFLPFKPGSISLTLRGGEGTGFSLKPILENPIVEGVVESVKSATNTAKEFIEEEIPEIWGNVTSTTKDIITEDIPEIWDNVTSTVEELIPEEVPEVLQGLVDWVDNHFGVSAFIEAIKLGIEEGDWSELGTATLDLVTNILASFLGVFAGFSWLKFLTGNSSPGMGLGTGPWNPLQSILFDISTWIRHLLGETPNVESMTFSQNRTLGTPILKPIYLSLLITGAKFLSAVGDEEGMEQFLNSMLIALGLAAIAFFVAGPKAAILTFNIALGFNVSEIDWNIPKDWLSGFNNTLAEIAGGLFTYTSFGDPEFFDNWWEDRKKAFESGRDFGYDFLQHGEFEGLGGFIWELVILIYRVLDILVTSIYALLEHLFYFALPDLFLAFVGTITGFFERLFNEITNQIDYIRYLLENISLWDFLKQDFGDTMGYEEWLEATGRVVYPEPPEVVTVEPGELDLSEVQDLEAALRFVQALDELGLSPEDYGAEPVRVPLYITEIILDQAQSDTFYNLNRFFEEQGVDLGELMIQLGLSESGLENIGSSESSAQGEFQLTGYARSVIEDRLGGVDWENDTERIAAAFHWLRLGIENELGTITQAMDTFGISLSEAIKLWWVAGGGNTRGYDGNHPGLRTLIADENLDQHLTLGKTAQEILDIYNAINTEEAFTVSVTVGEIDLSELDVDALFADMGLRFRTGAENTLAEYVQGLLDQGYTVEHAALELAETIGFYLIGESPPPKGPLNKIREGAKNTIKSWLEGFKDCFSDVEQVAKDMAQIVANYFVGQSPPPEGPLAEADIGGENTGKAVGEGIAKGIDLSLPAIKDILQSVKDLLGDLWNIVPEDLRKSIESAIDSISEGYDFVEELLWGDEDLTDLLNVDPANIPGLDEDDEDKKKEEPKTFGEHFKSGYDKLGFSMEGLANQVINAGSTLFTFAKELASGNYLEAFLSLFAETETFAKAMELLGNVLNPVIELIDNILGPVLGWFADIVSGLINFFIDAINVAISALNLIPFVNIKKVSHVGSDLKSVDKTERSSGGRQVSEITGPTRDILIDLLTPVANLNSIVAPIHSIRDILDSRLPNFNSMQFEFAGAGGVSVSIENLNVNSASNSADSVAGASISAIENALAKRIESNRRGKGL